MFRVLVAGVCLAGEPNNWTDTTVRLAESRHAVEQHWIAVGAGVEEPTARAGTVSTVPELRPKFELLDGVLAAIDLDAFDYVVLCDDDVVLPHRFLDAFLGLQSRLHFAIAQPARTANSFVDLPIVQQQRGVVARRTSFVEIGPVVSFAASAFSFVFPFDLLSPMGWGYEQVWTRHADDAGLPIGIIDAVAVDHSLRAPLTHYDWATADAGRSAYLAAHPHISRDDAFHVREVVGRDDLLADVAP